MMRMLRSRIAGLFCLGVLRVYLGRLVAAECYYISACIKASVLFFVFDSQEFMFSWIWRMRI
jgi:hypothetical protein